VVLWHYWAWNTLNWLLVISSDSLLLNSVLLGSYKDGIKILTGSAAINDFNIVFTINFISEYIFSKVIIILLLGYPKDPIIYNILVLVGHHNYKDHTQYLTRMRRAQATTKKFIIDLFC
jgi:hypothetical protein